MISSKSMDKIREMCENDWHFKGGVGYSNGSACYFGNCEVKRFMLDILKWENLDNNYLIDADNNEFEFMITTNTDIKLHYTIVLDKGTVYRPLDIYGKLSRAIEILKLKSEQHDKIAAYKHSLNSFYGMYVDTDDYAGDEKVYFNNALYDTKYLGKFHNASYDTEYLCKFQKVYGPSLKDQYNSYVKFDNNEHTIPAIKKVISNKPYTIVLWLDGTKTIVKQQPGETKYDPEKGLAMCIVKKMYGNNKWYDIFKRNLDPKYTKRKKVK